MASLRTHMGIFALLFAVFCVFTLYITRFSKNPKCSALFLILSFFNTSLVLIYIMMGSPDMVVFFLINMLGSGLAVYLSFTSGFTKNPMFSALFLILSASNGFLSYFPDVPVLFLIILYANLLGFGLAFYTSLTK